jgi:predicted adenine nucleotide alpha hydrolase (AANH) superfamily ATPase
MEFLLLDQRQTIIWFIFLDMAIIKFSNEYKNRVEIKQNNIGNFTINFFDLDFFLHFLKN